MNSTTQMIAATANHTHQNRERPCLRPYISSGSSGGIDDCRWVSFISQWLPQNCSSYGPPMVVPPLGQQNEEPEHGDGPPHFHVRPLGRGSAHFGVFAQLQFIARLDVALGGIEQVHAKNRFIRP